MAANRPTTAHAKRNANTMLQNYKEKKHCDLIVTAEEQHFVTGATANRQNPPDYSDVESPDDIYCHTTVLSANSSYFDTILATEFPGDGNNVLKTKLAGNAYGMFVKERGGKMVKIVLKDVDEEYLKPIIDYMYSGEIELTFNNLKHIYRNAKKLKVEQLIGDCKSFVQQEVTVSNCIELMMCAKEVGCEETEKQAFDFFLKNIPGVRQLSSGKIRRLPLDVMKKLMKSDKVNTENAEAAFRLLIIWADSDRINRSLHLHSLMEQKIELLPTEFLLNVLAKEEVVSSTLSTFKLVTSTLRVKQSASHPTLEFKQMAVASTSTSLVSPASQLSELRKWPFQSLCQGEPNTLLVFTGVFGVEGNGVHQKLDPDRNTWSEWTTKDMGFAYGVTVVGEWIAVLGGFKNRQIRANVEMYNLETNEWRAGPPMKDPRAAFSCCVMNGDTIVVCGGSTTGDEEFAECEMLKLNPDGSGRWQQLPPMTIKRDQSSAASIKNKIFVIGGQIGFGDTATVYSTVEEIDVTTKNWRARSSMKESRAAFATATHQNKVYVFGGRRYGNVTSCDCERYDSSTDKWQYICNLPSPRQACTAGLMGSKVYIIGDYYDGRLSDSTEIYDMENDTFVEAPNLSDSVFDPKCVVVKKHFLFN